MTCKHCGKEIRPIKNADGEVITWTHTETMHARCEETFVTPEEDNA